MIPQTPSCSGSLWFSLILSNFNSHNLSVRPQCGWGGSWVRHVGLPTLWGQRTSGPENSESGKHPQEAGLGSTQPVTSIPLDLKNGRWVTRGLGAVHQTAEGKGEARWRTADGGLGSSLSLKRLQSVFSQRYVAGSLPQDLQVAVRDLGRVVSLGHSPWHSAHYWFPSVFYRLCSLTVHRHGGFVNDAHHGLPGWPAARVRLWERVCHCRCSILYGICYR